MSLSGSLSRRDLLSQAALGGLVVGAAAPAAAEDAPAAGRPSAPRTLGFARGRVVDGGVEITAYKTARYGSREHDAEFRTLRVFRVETDFLFGTDYAEYFDGLAPTPGDLIFEGPLPAANGRKFIFHDEHAVVGRTYAYFIGSATASIAPAGPIPVKVRDPEVWWPYAAVVERLRRLEVSHPGVVRVAEIGKSSGGRPLYGVRAGSGKRVLGLAGTVHAGESGPELMLPALEMLLSEHRPLLERVAIAAIPSLNWQQRDREAFGLPWYLRTNANGVDLNRNFPAGWEEVSTAYGMDTTDPDSTTYRGPEPASEPETQAAIRFFRESPPIVAFSYHALASVTGSNLLAAQAGEKDAAYAARAERWSKAWGGGYAPGDARGYMLLFRTAGGSLPHWLYREFGAPAFDIELGPGNPDVCRTDGVDRALLKRYQERHAAALLAVVRALAESEP